MGESNADSNIAPAELPTSSPAYQRLEHEAIIWLASVRPDGRPHLVPLWFVWHAGRVALCVESASVKSRNIQHNPRVMLALDHGAHPVLCEGHAVAQMPPWPAAICALFQHKYRWDITTDATYNLLLIITPTRWLMR